METQEWIIRKTDPLLITGSTGFIGLRLVEALLGHGFQNLRCFARPSGDLEALKDVIRSFGAARVDILAGNLLKPEDCRRAVEGTHVIFHLAAGRGEKSYASAFLNSVVTTKNLLEAAAANGVLKRFLNVSSFTVYAAHNIKHNGLLDEHCPVESYPERRGEAYCYGKVKQDEIVMEYAGRYGLPWVIARPGVVFGPGNKGITGRVGIGTFGVFLHLGGSNVIPLSYVDNCAEALALAGLRKGIDGQTINIVDDVLPTSKAFLRQYKKNVEWFPSIYLPRPASYLLCCLWEHYSRWSKGQLPPTFNRNRWAADWKGHRYSNAKLRDLVGWRPKVGFHDALERYFAYERDARRK